MFGIQSKTTRHTKKQENASHNDEKKINQKIIHCKRKEQLTWEHSKRHHLKSDKRKKFLKMKTRNRASLSCETTSSDLICTKLKSSKGRVLEKTLESPLDSKEIKSVNPKGNQHWIFTGRIDDEAPVLRPPDANSQLIGRDPNVGKDWSQKEKGEERMSG